MEMNYGREELLFIADCIPKLEDNNANIIKALVEKFKGTTEEQWNKSFKETKSKLKTLSREIQGKTAVTKFKRIAWTEAEKGELVKLAEFLDKATVVPPRKLAPDTTTSRVDVAPSKPTTNAVSSPKSAAAVSAPKSVVAVSAPKSVVAKSMSKSANAMSARKPAAAVSAPKAVSAVSVPSSLPAIPASDSAAAIPAPDSAAAMLSPDDTFSISLISVVLEKSKNRSRAKSSTVPGRTTTSGVCAEPAPETVRGEPAPEMVYEAPRFTLATFDYSKPYVFISYKWGHEQKNHRKVKELVGELRSNGIHVWFDDDVMKQGSCVDLAIQGMNKAKCFIIIVSEEYVQSVNSDRDPQNACQSELKYLHSTQSKRRVLPVVVDQGALSEGGSLKVQTGLFWWYLAGLVHYNVFPESSTRTTKLNSLVETVKQILAT